MELVLYQIDAFTDQLFKGNPAAVCPLQTWLTDAQMQAIALENNLSETAFFCPEKEGFRLRWFTPLREVRLCGHATLATAHVLFRHLDYGKKKEQVNFQTLSGPLMVKRKADWYTMNFPIDHTELVPQSPFIQKALGVRPREIYRGEEDYLVILESEEQLLALRPDFRELAALDGRGVIVTAPGSEADFVSRCFYPKYGIDEDPVTGSAHTTLTPYWSKRLNRDRLTAIQASSRTGRLQLRLLNERVEISGQAVTYLQGSINL